jgi:hypothetical protein
MTSRYGISQYPDVPSAQAQLDELVATPIRTLTKEQLEDYHAWYAEHTPSSRAAAAEAESVIPGGVQHNLALNDPWPLEIVAASGAYLHDADGNRYVDFLQAGGPTVLGSNYEPVRQKVLELLASCGPVTGMLHSSEIALAKLIHDFMPGVQKFRMLGSGTEAVMAAIRAARAFTGKAHIIKIGGAYHGWSDQVVYGLRIPGTGSLEAAGIPAGALAATSEILPNDRRRCGRGWRPTPRRAAPPPSSWNRWDRSRAATRSRSGSTRPSANCAMSSARCSSSTRS